ncbi:MAG TPA: hypothetical protein VGO67_17415 [Verrucomicrobiae bacterium]|jgi:SAM-dependent methyltransferase
MLINEAKWLGEAAAKIEREDLTPCLNLGSQNAEFQQTGQPWINELFISPLKQRGVQITNTDLQQAPGVDIVGDLLDAEFFERLLGMGFGSAICCNILEHVTDIQRLASQVARIPRSGGWLFVSCPRAYPYHPDPLDNRFRPSPPELAALFPGFDVVASGEVECVTAWGEWSRGRYGAWSKVARLALPFIRYKGWQDTARRLPWVNKRFSASCCLLRRSRKAV